MWFFIWAVVSVFIIGVSAWSMQILLRQKAAWRAYAAKMNLTYVPGPRFLSSPSVSGTIGTCGFGLISEERPTTDARGQRYNTVIEISLRRGLPMQGVIATSGMLPLVNTLDTLTQTLTISDPDWDSTWLIKTANAAVLQAYLTQERRDVLKKIFRMKILDAMFIFNGDDAVLRVETAAALDDADKLEKIVKNLIQQLTILGPSDPVA